MAGLNGWCYRDGPDIVIHYYDGRMDRLLNDNTEIIVGSLLYCREPEKFIPFKRGAKLDLMEHRVITLRFVVVDSPREPKHYV